MSLVFDDQLFSILFFISFYCLYLFLHQFIFFGFFSILHQFPKLIVCVFSFSFYSSFYVSVFYAQFFYEGMKSVCQSNQKVRLLLEAILIKGQVNLRQGWSSQMMNVASDKNAAQKYHTNKNLIHSTNGIGIRKKDGGRGIK